MQTALQHETADGDATVPAAVLTEIERRVASGDLDLPVLPHVATQLLGGGMGDDVGLGDIATTLHGDQALAGHVLRVANSAAYAGGARIQSIQQALLRIGLTQLREIILGVVVGSRVFQCRGYEDLVRTLWRHSAVAGAYAREIARGLRTNAESAFLCGLLHDVGKPVVLALLLELTKKTPARPAPQACLGVLDLFHAAVGRSLAERWQLPEPVIEAIAHHHDFTAATRHAGAAQIACLANLLAHLTLDRPDGEAELRTHPVCPALNLYPDDLDALLAKREAMLELAEAFTGTQEP
jgi:putative nucleotidyltransferase with HDIG domain